MDNDRSFTTGIIKLSPSGNVLIFDLPALCMDAAGLNNLAQEIASCYLACSRGQEITDQPLQYVDVAKLLNEMLESENSRTGKRFWSSHKISDPLQFRLPFELRQSGNMRFEPHSYSRRIDPGIEAKINASAQSHNSTVFAFLLACWQILLWRMTLMSDNTIGVVLNDRGYEELKNLPGLFASYLPIHSHLEHHLKFSEVLTKVNETILDAWKWQECFSWEEMIGPGAGFSYPPFHSALFDYWEQPASHHANGISFTIVDQYTCHDRFKLKLSVRRIHDSLTVEFSYDSNLFLRSDIQRLTEQFQELLEGATSHTGNQISQIEMLSPAERHLLLVELNDTDAPYPKGMCFIDLFEEQVKSSPDNIALVFEDSFVSYGELNRRANRLGRYLRSKGVGVESKVGICVDRSIEMVVAVMGVLKAGGAYVPMEPGYPQERLTYMREEAEAEVVVTQRKYEEKFEGRGVEVIKVDECREQIEAMSCREMGVEVDEANLAYVIYTSGSTGKPKGVMIEQRGLVNYLIWAGRAYQSEGGRGTLVHTPVGFDLTVTSLLLPLVKGERVEMVSEQGGIEELAERLTKGGGYWLLKMTPAHVEAVTRLIGEQKVERAAEVIVIGGEALSYEQIKRWRGVESESKGRVINEYGPSETVVGCIVNEVGEEEGEGGVAIGRPISNARVYVMSESKRVESIGVEGEIYIGGAGVGRGYQKQAEETAERYVPDRYSERAGARMYRTGDVGKYQSDGKVEYIGRADNQVKVRGYRIELGEIEAVLSQHKQVRSCVVVARQEREAEKRLVCYYTSEGEVRREELREHLGRKLPEYMVPGMFIEMEQMPLTTNGKVDLRALPSADKHRATPDASSHLPVTPVERTLARIWQEVLRVEQVGVDDNFFELGGDSIFGIQVVARARQAGLKLAPKHLFQHQSISELARVATVCSATARDEESEGGEVALTPIQHWFFELGLKDVNHFNQAMIFESQERVDRRALEEAVEGVISHHEALRHSFRQEGGRWRQRSSGSQRVDEEGPIGREVVEEVDIREMSGQEEEREMDRAHKGLDISEGRMMKVLVMRGRESDRVLIVIHHLAIDVVSWAIVLEDLRRGYEQARRGEEVRIGERSGSYKQWAEELERYAKSDEVLREVEYWTGESKRVREEMRVDREGENEERSSEVEEVEVSEEVSERLMKEVSRAYRVRMNEVVLGAVVEGVGRWSGMRKVKIEVEGHGREEVGEIDVSRTVGWFTVIAPIVVERGREVEETLRRVKEEVRGMEKGGIGYGLLRYMRGDEEVSERIREMGEGEIIYNYLGRVEEVVGEEGGMKVRGGGGRSRGEGKRRYKLEVTGYVEGGKVKVEIGYSGGKYERESIREIKKGIGEAMEEMVERSSRAKGEEFSPADFPLVRLDNEKMIKIAKMINSIDD